MWTGTVDIAENLFHHTHSDGYRRTLGGFFIEGTLIIRDYGLMIFFLYYAVLTIEPSMSWLEENVSVNITVSCFYVSVIYVHSPGKSVWSVASTRVSSSSVSSSLHGASMLLWLTTFPTYSPLQISSQLVSLLYSTRQHLKRKGAWVFLVAASGGMYICLPWTFIAEVPCRLRNCKWGGKSPTSMSPSICKSNKWKYLLYENFSRT